MPTSERPDLSWQQLSSARKAAVVLIAVVELVLTGVALRDLFTRPAALVRGPKALWFAACLVQPIGPPAYLLRGRRTG